MLKEPAKRRSIFSFFHTEAGRKLVIVGASVTTIGLFLGNFVPQTFGLNKYKDFLQCYRNGVARPVSEKVMKRLENAMDKLDVPHYERFIIKPFTVCGFDLFQAGSSKYRFGCALGIPVNYDYDGENDIDRNDIRSRNEKINWDSESGRLLQEALLLSEEEQVFGLCKSILQLQTHRTLMNSIFPSVSFLMVYTMGNYLNMKLNLLPRPFGLRLFLYTLLGLFGVGTWSFMKDYNQVIYDTQIDRKLCSLGPEFVATGIRFYDKTLKKNMALRALIGDDTYTAKGNENYMLRQKSLPITIRKSFFEQQWKQLQEGGTPETQ